MKLLIISFLVLMPGFIKPMFYYDNSGYLDRIFSFDMPGKFIEQLMKHCMN